jgi:putative ABC transport system substrate-binding protein
MRRREFIAFLGGSVAAWSLAALAQQPRSIKRVGVLMPLGEDDPEARPRITAFAQALGGMGWSEGETVAFEVRYADGKPERLPALAADLVHANVDVIVTQAAQPVEAARDATSTIPIVMVSVGDALGAGYIASLARPGGNITGQTLVATEQSTKRLATIKQIYPDIAHIAVLGNSNASGHRLQLKAMQQSAPLLKVALQPSLIDDAAEIEAGLRTAIQAGAQAILTIDDPMIQSNRVRIVEIGLRQNLPVIGEFKPMVAAGGLMSYGPDQIEMWRGAAAYVDKILRGAKPGDLPVQQPTKFELVINLKTAKTLGVVVPPTLLAAADEVIE